MDRASVFAEITKYERQDDGSLLVQGVASDSTVDIDQQIADSDWLKTAMPDWFRWGNIRQMHRPDAAGVATEYAEKDGSHHIVAKVVDPGAITKVENRVYKGFSIGIKNPRVVLDKAAAGGRIVDGQVVEVSLVDRPANPACTLTLAKAAVPGIELREPGDFDAERMLVRVEEAHEVDHTKAAEPDLGKAAEPDEAKGAGTATGCSCCPECTGSCDGSCCAACQASKPPAGAGAPVPESGATATNGPSSSVKAADPDATPEPTVEPVGQSPADPAPAAGEEPGTETPGAVDGLQGKAAAVAAPGPTPDPEPADADAVAKAVAAVLPGLLAAELAKREFTAADRKRLAGEGKAMPGGGFPIATVGDLKNAIQAIGRAKNPAAAKAHIKERARALNREDLIPDAWKGADPDLGKAIDADEMAHDPATLRAVRDGLLNLLIAEAQEALAGEREEYDLQTLVRTLAMFLAWWDHETYEGEAPASSDLKGAQPDATKTTGADPAPVPTPDPAPGPGTETPAAEAGTTVDDTVKAAVAEALQPLRQENEKLRARLAEVEKAAAPGGPVRTPTTQQRADSAEADRLRTDAAKYRAIAKTFDDQEIRAEYERRAMAAENELRKLAAA